MSAEGRLKVVLCWHMHQPQYCNMMNGEYQQPWTYLHAIKDYVDMAAHLEAVPEARAVVNFAPVLLDQIADYAGQVRGFLSEGKPIRDPLLAALANPALPNDRGARLSLIQACRRANRTRVIERFPPFKRLVDMAQWACDHADCMDYLSDQFLVDLLTWYHLGWLGETVRRSDNRVQRLQDRGCGYTLHERRQLLGIIGELLSGVLDRYGRLAAAGRVELAVSPYAHPIVPLLLDLHSAREALPDIALPHHDGYPGGRARAEWHLQEALNTFEQYFGARPTGCWPSEGSVSTATLELLEQHGFRWAASGETVLFNSRHRYHADEAPARDEVLYRPQRVAGGELACFFRDDGLSDLIGFTYSDWHADDAVANLVHALEEIADRQADPAQRVVSIILDGENAWEYYPENGFYFLSALYKRLAEHPRLELTTFSGCLDDGVVPAALDGLVAGSWVYGTFSTWIGDADKNRAWEMLIEAKRAFDRITGESRLDSERLLASAHQLAICEGSDWFWWFGDYNPAGTVQDFDRLYRTHLTNLYQFLGLEPPEYLAHSFSHGTTEGKAELGGVMRHGQPAG